MTTQTETTTKLLGQSEKYNLHQDSWYAGSDEQCFTYAPTNGFMTRQDKRTARAELKKHAQAYAKQVDGYLATIGIGWVVMLKKNLPECTC